MAKNKMAVEEMHNNDMEILEFTTKIGGVILRKAELEKDFTGVYEKVFAKMLENEVFGGEELLEIFGDVGG